MLYLLGLKFTINTKYMSYKINSLVFTIFAALCGVSSVAIANPNMELQKALHRRDFKEAARIFNENTIDPNFTWESDRGVTTFYLAVDRNQWEMADRMLDDPRTNVNAGPFSGPNCGVTALWWGAYCKNWGLVRRMLEHRDANVNATPLGTDWRGANLLWLAMRYEQTEIAELMLNRPDVNVNSAPVLGPGETALWLASMAIHMSPPDAREARIRLFERMLMLPNPDFNARPPRFGGRNVVYNAATVGLWKLVHHMVADPNTDVNAGPTTGEFAGASTFLWALNDQQFETVALIIARHPDANLETAFMLPGGRGRTILEGLNALAPGFVLNQLLVSYMNRDVVGVDLRTQLGNPIPSSLGCARIWERTRALEDIFCRASVAFPHFADQPCLAENSIITVFPRDVRWLMALAFLRAEDPDLVRIDNNSLKRLLLRFQWVRKPIDYRQPAVKLVACQVLNAICPLAERDQRMMSECGNAGERKRLSSKKGRVVTVRRWIESAVVDAIALGTVPQILVAPVRARVVEILSLRPIAKVTRTWIEQRLSHFMEPVLLQDVEAAQETDKPMRKRLRAEDVAPGEPGENEAAINLGIPNAPGFGLNFDGSK